MAAGVLLLLLDSAAVLMCEHIAPLSIIGGLMMCCGIATAVVVGTQPKQMTPAVRRDYSAVATGLIVAGLFLGTFL